MDCKAECARLPFDLPEAEEELVAGYQTEYSGGLFYLVSYLNLLVSSLFVTVLYLGGWNFSITPPSKKWWYFGKHVVNHLTCWYHFIIKSDLACHNDNL